MADDRIESWCCLFSIHTVDNFNSYKNWLPLQEEYKQEEDLEGRFLRGYSWLQDKTQKDLAVSIDSKCKAFYESSVYKAVRGNGTHVLSNQTFPLQSK